MEARADPDRTRPIVRDQIESLWSDIRSCFAAWEAGNGELDGVEEALARLRYLDNAMALTDGVN